MAASAQYLREALWQEFERRCWLCLRIVDFSELEIDHLIPQSLADSPDDLRAVLDRLGLPADFDVYSACNLRPAHGRCNRLKSHRITPMIAFQIQAGEKAATRAADHARRMKSTHTASYGMAIIERELDRGPLSVELVNRMVGCIVRSEKLIHKRRETNWMINFDLPSPWCATELVRAIADLRPLAKSGLTHKLGLCLGIVIGVRASKAGLLVHETVRFHACFAGLNRPLSPRIDEIFTFIQRADFGYQFDGELKKISAPKNAVVASYFRASQRNPHELELVSAEWLEADPQADWLPKEHDKRYERRCW